MLNYQRVNELQLLFMWWQFVDRFAAMKNSKNADSIPEFWSENGCPDPVSNPLELRNVYSQPQSFTHQYSCVIYGDWMGFNRIFMGYNLW